MKTIPNHHVESNQSHFAQPSELIHPVDNASQTDNSAFSNIHPGMKLVPYSSLNQELRIHLQQMGLTPDQTPFLLPIEKLYQEWGSDLWIGNKINPLVVAQVILLKLHRVQSRTQVCKAIRNAAISAGYVPGIVKQNFDSNKLHKHLLAKV